MKKNIKFILISILAVFLFHTPNVFASTTTERSEIKIDNKTVYKRYDNNATGEKEKDGAAAGLIKVTIDGKEYPGFCIDFGMAVTIGNAEEPFSLYDYFRNALNEETTNELIKKLTFYSKYGYGSTGRTTDKYYLATQKLIWEAIDATGFYVSEYYYERSGMKFDISNFEWTINKETVIDLSEEISAIQNSINQYSKTPSLCSSQSKIEIEVGETAEYTDNNDVLSQYQVVCSDGITCKISGNKLTVTATNKTGNHQITFLKPQTGSENHVYRVGGTQGIIIVDEGVLEEVSCKFGIDSFKNVQTADKKIIYIITIGLFSGVIAYIMYYTKKTLDELK